MKTKVAARESPWVEGWEALVKDPLSRADYRPGVQPNMGASRQRASRDAHAAYLNFIRWYVSGEKSHADAAIRICNEWSGIVDRIPSGTDTPGLSGIFAAEFAMVGELLRVCPDWRPDDRARFAVMLRNYLYPVVSGFLRDRQERGDSHYWANWDICNIQALLAIGVFLDDRDIFQEGIDYFHHGKGTGSIRNAVPFLHPGNLGQWQESGRDQPHAQLGIGMMAQAATIAWNQGVDLFASADNRLLAAAEYAAREALSQPVPYTPYSNSSRSNNHWLSNHTRGRFSIPIWELLHNHYVVRRGHAAPALKRVAELSRPEGGGWDHFGYGTLTFTLDARESPYPPLPPPAAPTGLRARPGSGYVELSWDVPARSDVSRYVIRRARKGGDDWETILDRAKHSAPRHVDREVEPGVSYRYVVIAANQAGDSPASESVEVAVGGDSPLPTPWEVSRIGRVSGNAEPGAWSNPGGGQTIRLRGGGNGVGGKSDDAGFVHRPVTGDFVFTARVVGPEPSGLGGSPLAQFGLMARESTDGDSRMVTVTLGEGGLRGTRFRHRDMAGGNAETQAGNDYSWSPIWYRLTRRGDTFIAEHRIDDSEWFEVGRAELKGIGPMVVGFVVATRNPDGTGEVLFEEISLDP